MVRSSIWKSVLTSTIVMTAFLAVLLAGVCGGQVQKAEAATSLSANKTYTFTTTSSSATYTYKMPKTGYYYVQITPTVDPSEYGGSYLAVKMTSDYRTYENEYVSYDDGVWASSKFSFKPGATMDIKIGCDYAERAYSYKVRIVAKNPKNFETENNNSVKKADKIKKLSTSYSGILIKSDTDVWKYTATKTGKYKIYGVCTSDSGSCSVKLKKGSKSINTDYLFEGDGWNNLSKTYKASTVKLKKGQSITISLGDSYASTSYKLKVKKVS